MYFSTMSRASMQFLPESRDKRRQGLAVGGVEAGEDFAAGAELSLPEAVERGLDGVEEFVEIARIGFDKEEAGDDLACRVALLQVGQRRDPVSGIVVKGELPHPQDRAVVLH